MTKARGSAEGSSLAMVVAVWAGLGLSTGCHKNARAEFHRPPASASVPETVPEVAEAEPEVQSAAVETDATSEVPQPVEETAPEPQPAQPKPSPPPSPAPAPPPRLQLPRNQPDAREAESIADKLDRTADLFPVLRNRPLSVEQREQVEAAQAFVAQARTALAEGDVVRASVLGDKGFLLAEDVERASR